MRLSLKLLVSLLLPTSCSLQIKTPPPNMIQLIKNADVYAPAHLGLCHVLVGCGKIMKIFPGNVSLHDETVLDLNISSKDLNGKKLIPGLIDGHVHLTGGGGEAGFKTSVPPIPLSNFTLAGVTTAVGVLGTDDCVRSTASLLARARGLREEGLSSYILTGGYHVPVTTLTGSVKGDIVHLDLCIGCGELAISDHRSSQPTFDELVRIAGDCHVAHLMTGKAGTLHLHMGTGERRMQMVKRALQETEIPSRIFNPTHCNRNFALLEEAMELASLGATIDVTAGTGKKGGGGGPTAAEAIRKYITDDRKLPQDKITCSSDAGGSIPTFDEQGNLLRLGYGTSANLLVAINELLSPSDGSESLPLEAVLPPFTSNWASLLKIDDRKGKIAEGCDADLVVLEESGDGVAISDVMALGVWHVVDGKAVIKGTFES
mmetsp:Transcript_1274/g.2761  ORF Transcript_1274/g.2761 Transcript_1274/m.2761 type:complete len:431 (-) Transcript_1274:186-1478(-)